MDRQRLHKNWTTVAGMIDRLMTLTIGWLDGFFVELIEHAFHITQGLPIVKKRLSVKPTLGSLAFENREEN